MATCSVSIICKDEERNIARVLTSVRWADEIVVVDSFSTDRTVEIALGYTPKVYQIPWQGYVAQKNSALTLATGDWILAIDSDEEVSEALAASIKEVLAADDPAVAGYQMARRVRYMGKWIRWGGWYPDRKVRLVRRGKARWEGLDPHDKLVADGKVRRLSGDLLHYSFPTVIDHLKTIDRFTTVAAAELHRRGKKGGPFKAVSRGTFMFFRSYLLRLGFLEGYRGVVIATLSAYHVFIKYAKLWELDHPGESGEGTR